MNYYKKGGQFRYALTELGTSNTFTLPAGCRIDDIIVEKLDAVNTTITVGVTGTLDAIVGSTNINSIALTRATLTKRMYSTTADQDVIVTLSRARSANVYVLMSKLV